MQKETTRKEMVVSAAAVVSGVGGGQVRPRQSPQYLVCLSVTLGAVASGTVMGWTSPAGDDGSNLWYDFAIDTEDFSWISSATIIGAALVGIPIGLIIDLIGRRRSILTFAVTFTIGWACVIWPNSITMLILGRFILGASGGAFFVLSPIYTAEISDSETRGRLGSYFECFLDVGILGCYALGLLNNMFLLSLISATVPIIFFAVFIFMPETPTYHLMKGNVEAARDTLIWLRGKHYDVESELEEKRMGLVKFSRGEFFTAIRSRAALKGLLITYGLMFFQAFSGIDIIIFYVSDIFADANGYDGNLSAVFVGAVQVVAIFSHTFVIDKWGRRLLLLMSGLGMCLSNLALGVYFYLYENDNWGNDFKWVPLVTIPCFVCFYCLGYAAIPWVMIGELFSPQIKAVAGSTASMTCWISSFVVVKFYSVEKAKIGDHGVFWCYSAIIAAGIVFVYFVVPETKNKSLEQIQIELSSKVESDGGSKSTKK